MRALATAALMDSLEREGVVFGLVAGELALNAPAGVLTAGVRAAVTEHKAAMTRLVRAAYGWREYGNTEKGPPATGERGNTEKAPATPEELGAASAALGAAPRRRLTHSAWLAASGLTPTAFARARRALLEQGEVRNLGPAPHARSRSRALRGAGDRRGRERRGGLFVGGDRGDPAGAF